MSGEADRTLDDQAAAWLCEQAEGFTPGRAEAFAAWRDASLRHAAALARVERALALLDEMPAVRAPLEARFGRASDPAENPPEVRDRRARSHWRTIFAAAAALVLGLAAWRFLPAAATGPTGERYSAAAATQRRVALSDGSIVDINAAGDMRVDFSQRERRVSLAAGEAHFQVAADATRPFVVTAAGVSVRAVGTAFNVRIGADAVDVLVVKGSVEVANGERRPSAAATERPVLEAGERVRVPRHVAAANLRVEKVDSSAMRSLLAWQDQMTSFIDVPLRELVARFNRCNATQLVLRDAELGERRVGGMIALDQVDAFVRLLEQDGDIRAERNGAEIVLRRVR